jgi:HK97 family phage major capsid protein
VSTRPGEVSGTNSITYTTSTPSLAGLYAKLADAIQQIGTGIFMPATHVVMHPRRWAFCLASSDSNNRPLIVPTAQGPFASAGQTSGVVAEGPVGSIQGLPVYVDPNIPTTFGASTTEDRIIVFAQPDLYLWEDQSGPYLETFRDVLSGTLSVRFQLHNYWAQLFARRPKAISVVSGSGLVAPSF